MQQQQLDIEPPLPRERGRVLADKCADRAERVSDFDVQGAKRFILGWLARYGRQSGEQLVDAAIAHGFRPHDGRAYGAVFQQLVREERIRCVGTAERRKGHGTAGARLWELALP